MASSSGSGRSGSSSISRPRAAAAGVLVETALAERASPMAARCVGAATVVAGDAGPRRQLATHPVLPFPPVSKPSVEAAIAWLGDRFERYS
jgi:hypothetical protein